MTTTGRRPGRAAARAGRARLVVLAILVVNLSLVLVLPMTLTDPTSTPSRLLVGVSAVALGAVLVLVLRAAVTPWVGTRQRHGLVALLMVVALATWPVTSAWAEPGQEPWAWVVGAVAGVLPLVLRWTAALTLGTTLVGAAGVGALVWQQSVTHSLVIAAATAVLVVVMGQVLVWLLRLLVAAEAGRAAEADLAVSAERLRVAQELHDVLGHRLTVIALRAEVAGDLTAVDADRARSEAVAVRDLATTTLREVRSTVHGYGTVDLAEQLRTAELVLASAGVRAEVCVGSRAGSRVASDGPAPVQDPAASQLVAAVVREAVTNLLRHSDAENVSLDLASDAAGTTLVVVNDGVRPAEGGAGTGLAGLAERARRAGASLTWMRDGDRFEVRLEVAHR